MDPLDYFCQCVDQYEGFRGREFDCEDLNLRAFASKDAFRDWFGQPPGAIGQPYRDEGFYVRELSTLSMLGRPRKVLEMGTAQGLGTLILRMLNPQAEIITVDNRSEIPTADGLEHPTGFLALQNGAEFTQVLGESFEVDVSSVDFTFIDADHSEEGVRRDSERAFEVRNPDGRWCIAWHDYNDRHPGCMKAVGEFIGDLGFVLHRPQDSSTVWTFGGLF